MALVGGTGGTQSLVATACAPVCVHHCVFQVVVLKSVICTL